MWESIQQWIVARLEGIWNGLIKPLWSILTSWIQSFWVILAMFLAIFEMLLGLLEWVFDTLTTKVPVLANAAQTFKNPSFGSSANMLAFANRIVPVQEAFDFFQLTLAIGGAALAIKVAKWLWSIFRG